MILSRAGTRRRRCRESGCWLQQIKRPRRRRPPSRDRWFESASLQQRVRKPSVPRRFHGFDVKVPAPACLTRSAYSPRPDRYRPFRAGAPAETGCDMLALHQAITKRNARDRRRKLQPPASRSLIGAELRLGEAPPAPEPWTEQRAAQERLAREFPTGDPANSPMPEQMMAWATARQRSQLCGMTGVKQTCGRAVSGSSDRLHVLTWK